MNAKRHMARAGRSRATSQLSVQVGEEIVRFQEASKTVDQIAAAILRLELQDLPCMTMLLFGGPATMSHLAETLNLPLHTIRDAIARLEMAGYARRSSGRDGSRVELTMHAREWIDRLWEPLRYRGLDMLANFSREELSLIVRVLRAARDVQERHIADLRQWLTEPASARKSHQRGGLSPAALRRVQVFIESNIDRPVHIGDLASRAGLSVHHFGRAFRTSTGATPRAYLERLRIDRARALIGGTDKPLAAIAVETGFGTQSHFTTAFRRATGFTPAAYRRGLRG